MKTVTLFNGKQKSVYSEPHSLNREATMISIIVSTTITHHARPTIPILTPNEYVLPRINGPIHRAADVQLWARPCKVPIAPLGRSGVGSQHTHRRQMQKCGQQLPLRRRRRTTPRLSRASLPVGTTSMELQSTQ